MHNAAPAHVLDGRHGTSVQNEHDFSSLQFPQKYSNVLICDDDLSLELILEVYLVVLLSVK
jgi:hypothetical protein